MLRRLKESVATELLEKKEITLYCPLSPYQICLTNLVKKQLHRKDAAQATFPNLDASTSAATSVSGLEPDPVMTKQDVGKADRDYDGVASSVKGVGKVSSEVAKLRDGNGTGSAGLNKGKAQSMRAVNNTVMELRNICNHPFIR